MLVGRGEIPRKPQSGKLTIDPIERIQQKVEKFCIPLCAIAVVKARPGRKVQKTSSTKYSAQSSGTAAMSSRKSPDSQASLASGFEEEGSPLCIELTLEQGKPERIVLNQYESLNDIIAHFTRKYC